jgi:hypothetical protein
MTPLTLIDDAIRLRRLAILDDNLAMAYAIARDAAYQATGVDVAHLD